MPFLTTDMSREVGYPKQTLSYLPIHRLEHKSSLPCIHLLEPKYHWKPFAWAQTTSSLTPWRQCKPTGQEQTEHAKMLVFPCSTYKTLGKMQIPHNFKSDNNMGLSPFSRGLNAEIVGVASKVIFRSLVAESRTQCLESMGTGLAHCC